MIELDADMNAHKSDGGRIFSLNNKVKTHLIRTAFFEGHKQTDVNDCIGWLFLSCSRIINLQRD